MLPHTSPRLQPPMAISRMGEGEHVPPRGCCCLPSPPKCCCCLPSPNMRCCCLCCSCVSAGRFSLDLREFWEKDGEMLVRCCAVATSAALHCFGNMPAACDAVAVVVRAVLGTWSCLDAGWAGVAVFGRPTCLQSTLSTSSLPHSLLRSPARKALPSHRMNGTSCALQRHKSPSACKPVAARQVAAQQRRRRQGRGAAARRQLAARQGRRVQPRQRQQRVGEAEVWS